MKILLDHNVPAYLRREAAGEKSVEIATTARLGWQLLVNGKLLAAAQSRGFNILVTRDLGFCISRTCEIESSPLCF